MQELVAANQLISKIINCERKTSQLKVSLSIYMYKLLQKCFIIGGKRGKNACPQVSDDGRIIVTINQLCLNGSCIIISIYLYSRVWLIYEFYPLPLELQGANSYGQLGLGNHDDHLLPQKVVLPETLDGTILNQPVANRIKSITGGGGHSIIIQGRKCQILVAGLRGILKWNM